MLKSRTEQKPDLMSNKRHTQKTLLKCLVMEF